MKARCSFVACSHSTAANIVVLEASTDYDCNDCFNHTCSSLSRLTDPFTAECATFPNLGTSSFDHIVDFD